MKSTGAVKQFVGGIDNKIYYRHTGGLYWKIFTNFAPKFHGDGAKQNSQTQTSFSMLEKDHVLSLIASLSSDVFWWYYTIASNLRDMSPYDINHFPIITEMLNDSALQNLGNKYMQDLKKNSEMLTRHQKSTGTTQTQQFKISKSKTIIDEIDKIIAKHYGFSEEELDYIVNYDYKYRMGGADD